ncbi:unnamed protein product [Lepeophtheirus salmonis]|uniref:(salmon louse) hypothetical protein n=1 Tax=Lepeophtheirus salmonis TaxID=72036 RepID=A0A7R8GZM7_LEPSM|nr:unnamed protein product [Lepeophtheirus salmonis]CAF2755324.1 unnamed protein product [Lepeophtheirus salmonis]
MRLNTDEIIEILGRLDSNNDIIMGFPDVNDLSDGDSDKSDEKAIGDSDRLSRLLLQASAHIEQDEHVDEMEENIPSNSKKHARRRWRKDDRDCPISQSVITLPPSNVAMSLDKCHDFFELFFDEELLSEIVFQTNLYAFQKNENLDLTISELEVFIGGLLLSATCHLPNKRKYWSSEDNVPKLLANSMRRDRFIDILHNIHFHDNTLKTNDRASK